MRRVFLKGAGWALLCALCALTASCSSCSSQGDNADPGEKKETVSVPAQLDSGFVFERDALSFANYGSPQFGIKLSTPQIVRMFGEEQVCLEGSDPCVLLPAVEQWRDSVSRSLEQGHSDGFAVLSMLLYTGAVDATKFGGENAGQLRIAGNTALQQEVLYWAATQFVPEATEHDVRKSAADVMPFLTEALAPDSEGHYRLAIAQRTERGFENAHSLVPFGFFKGEGDVFWLRLYDSNYPSREQRMAIDPVANTWRYEVATVSGEPLVYEGGPDDPLYFSRVEDRLGVLPSPFAEDGKYTVFLVDPAQTVTISDGEGSGGIDRSKVTESEGHQLVPVFSKCPGCGEDYPITNYRYTRNFEARREVEVKVSNPNAYSSEMSSGEDGALISRHNHRTERFGSTVHSSIETTGGGIGDDVVSFSDSGDVSYTSSSEKSVKVKRSSGSSSVEVEFEHTGDEDVTVTVTQKPDGKVEVVIEGLPEGTPVSVSYGANGGAPQKTTFESTAGKSTTSVDTNIRDGDRNLSANVEGGDNVQGGVCTNGKKDGGFESDVDCGGECSACDDGKRCEDNNDCTNQRCIKAVSHSIRRCMGMGELVVIDAQTGMATRTPVCRDGGACDEDALCADKGPYCSLAFPYCNGDGTCDVGECTDAEKEYYKYGTCRALVCDNGVKDGNETDVDCGGDTCAPCVASTGATAPACTQNSDCDSGLCTMGQCRPRVSIRLKPSGTGKIWPGGSTVEYMLDGKMQSKRIYEDMDGKHGDVELGEGWFLQLLDVQGCTHSEAVQSPPEATDPSKVYELPLTCDGSYYEMSYTVTYDPGLASLATLSANEEYFIWRTRVPQMQVSAEFGGKTESNPVNIRDGGLLYMTYDTSWNAQITRQSNYVVPVPQDKVAQFGADAVGQHVCSIRNSPTSDPDQGNVDVYCAWELTTCDDGVKNQRESDVDCGGPYCPGTCELGESCYDNAHCESGYCLSGICTLGGGDCADGIKNSNEGDIDCGGRCPACDLGKSCRGDSGCSSGYCEADVCTAPTCDDGVRNQGERGVDCGGAGCDTCTPVCAPCADNLYCVFDADCASGDCVLDASGMNGYCASSTCFDGIKNQDETDVDCGGAVCAARCQDAQVCTDSTDCEVGLPCTNGVCGASCVDGIKNQNETDIDCGGNCGPCALNQACSTDAECSSGSCYCDANSGNCPGATGVCGAAKLLVDQPVTDGTSASATFTVPASCSSLYVQAWGAAGGSESMGMMFAGQPGGAGGFVSGTLPVAQGDQVTIWLGQGGGSDINDQSAGSLYGTPAFGGFGDDDLFTGGGGDGGGLTSVQITGSVNHAFSIPGGGGSSTFTTGEAATEFGGGGQIGNEGESASNNSMEPGGGAGEPGGTTGMAGAFGTLPAGLTVEDGVDDVPGGTARPDYANCVGVNGGVPMGAPGAGAGDFGGALGIGGDACIVLRCVAP